MLALVVFHLGVFQLIERTSEVVPIADISAELLGNAGERIGGVEVAPGGLGDLVAERVVAEGDQDCRDVAEES